MKKKFEQFNSEDTLLVISSYPPKGAEPAKQNAVASYCQNLLRAYKGRKIVVLSEIVDKESKVYKEDNVLVVPCWKYRSPTFYTDVLKQIVRFDKSSQLLIQFEFNMLGSFVHSALLPFFMSFIRLMGKSVTVMMHQVVNDLSVLSGHINIKKGSLKCHILNIGLRAFYFFAGKGSNAIIVHEENLKKRLSRWVDERKISVVSHGLSLEDQLKGRSKLRESMGIKDSDFVILMFGYLTWYKGTDWIIRKVKKLAKTNPELNVKLVVAGGKSASLKNKPHYKRFLSKVEELSKGEDSIIMTGYVPDSEVAKYFTLSDLVALPYRVMMSASGPFSFALRFNKPFIISDTLATGFNNPDVKFGLNRLEMKVDDFTFKLRGDSFDDLIEKLSSDKKALAKITALSSDLRKLRNWKNIVKEYNYVLDNASYSAAFARIRGSVFSKLTRPLAL